MAGSQGTNSKMRETSCVKSAMCGPVAVIEMCLILPCEGLVLQVCDPGLWYLFEAVSVSAPGLVTDFGLLTMFDWLTCLVYYIVCWVS